MYTKWERWYFKIYIVCEDIYWTVRNWVWPQNDIIRRAVPRGYSDVDHIMRDVLFACVKQFYESEKPEERLEWLKSDLWGGHIDKDYYAKEKEFLEWLMATVEWIDSHNDDGIEIYDETNKKLVEIVERRQFFWN